MVPLCSLMWQGQPRKQLVVNPRYPLPQVLLSSAQVAVVGVHVQALKRRGEERIGWETQGLHRTGSLAFLPVTSLLTTHTQNRGQSIL